MAIITILTKISISTLYTGHILNSNDRKRVKKKSQKPVETETDGDAIEPSDIADESAGQNKSFENIEVLPEPVVEVLDNADATDTPVKSVSKLRFLF